MFTCCNVFTVQCLHWAVCALHRAHQIPWGTEEHIRGIGLVACNPVAICGGRRLSMAVAGRRKVVFCKEDFVQPIFQWKQLFSQRSNIPMFHHLLTKAALKHSLDDVDWFSGACVGELAGHQGIINPLNTKTFQTFLGFSQSIFFFAMVNEEALFCAIRMWEQFIFHAHWMFLHRDNNLTSSFLNSELNCQGLLSIEAFCCSGRDKANSFLPQ